MNNDADVLRRNAELLQELCETENGADKFVQKHDDTVAKLEETQRQLAEAQARIKQLETHQSTRESLDRKLDGGGGGGFTPLNRGEINELFDQAKVVEGDGDDDGAHSTSSEVRPLKYGRPLAVRTETEMKNVRISTDEDELPAHLRGNDPQSLARAAAYGGPNVVGKCVDETDGVPLFPVYNRDSTSKQTLCIENADGKPEGKPDEDLDHLIARLDEDDEKDCGDVDENDLYSYYTPRRGQLRDPKKRVPVQMLSDRDLLDLFLPPEERTSAIPESERRGVGFTPKPSILTADELVELRGGGGGGGGGGDDDAASPPHSSGLGGKGDADEPTENAELLARQLHERAKQRRGFHRSQSRSEDGHSSSPSPPRSVGRRYTPILTASVKPPDTEAAEIHVREQLRQSQHRVDYADANPEFTDIEEDDAHAKPFAGDLHVSSSPGEQKQHRDAIDPPVVVRAGNALPEHLRPREYRYDDGDSDFDIDDESEYNREQFAQRGERERQRLKTQSYGGKSKKPSPRPARSSKERSPPPDFGEKEKNYDVNNFENFESDSDLAADEVVHPTQKSLSPIEQRRHHELLVIAELAELGVVAPTAVEAAKISARPPGSASASANANEYEKLHLANYADAGAVQPWHLRTEYRDDFHTRLRRETGESIRDASSRAFSAADHDSHKRVLIAASGYAFLNDFEKAHRDHLTGHRMKEEEEAAFQRTVGSPPPLRPSALDHSTSLLPWSQQQQQQHRQQAAAAATAASQSRHGVVLPALLQSSKRPARLPLDGEPPTYFPAFATCAMPPSKPKTQTPEGEPILLGAESFFKTLAAEAAASTTNRPNVYPPPAVPPPPPPRIREDPSFLVQSILDAPTSSAAKRSARSFDAPPA